MIMEPRTNFLTLLLVTSKASFDVGEAAFLEDWFCFFLFHSKTVTSAFRFNKREAKSELKVYNTMNIYFYVQSLHILE